MMPADSYPEPIVMGLLPAATVRLAWRISIPLSRTTFVELQHESEQQQLSRLLAQLPYRTPRAGRQRSEVGESMALTRSELQCSDVLTEVFARRAPVLDGAARMAAVQCLAEVMYSLPTRRTWRW